MGSSTKTAEPPKAVAAPSNTVPYGQTSTQAIPWTNNLPNPATGDPLRPAQLSDPTWQSGTQIPATPATTAAAPPQDIDALKAILAALMSGSGSGEFIPDYFGSSNGGGGIGGGYTTSGGGNYGSSSSSYGSAAGQAGGKGKGLY